MQPSVILWSLQRYSFPINLPLDHMLSDMFDTNRSSVLRTLFDLYYGSYLLQTCSSPDVWTDVCRRATTLMEQKSLDICLFSHFRNILNRLDQFRKF
jgi:hypothetical protein